MMIQKIIEGIRERGWHQGFDALTALELKDINEFFDAHKSQFSPALIGTGANKQRLESVRGDFTFWLDPLSVQKPFPVVFKLLQDLQTSLNQNFFLGLKQFECHLAYYPAGYHYKKHLDRFDTASSRSFSFIFYLHQSWKEGDGGELDLFDKHDVLLKRIQPIPGSMVGFISEDFPHEVRPSNIERRSLTGWMHTKLLY
jgi:SM-20-related protein